MGQEGTDSKLLLFSKRWSEGDRTVQSPVPVYIDRQCGAHTGRFIVSDYSCNAVQRIAVGKSDVQASEMCGQIGSESRHDRVVECRFQVGVTGPDI